jgi:hypothetical protein
MQRGIWEDWLNLVLGAWLIIAPFLGVGLGTPAAVWNSYIVGVAVLVFAWVALSRPHRWEEIINLVLGVWLIISPFVLGYAHLRGAMWSHVIIGVVIGLDALLAMRSPVHYRHVT